jgi:hypothetical protein
VLRKSCVICGAEFDAVKSTTVCCSDAECRRQRHADKCKEIRHRRNPFIVPRLKPKDRPSHYVSNDELREEIIRCKIAGELSKKALELLQKMVVGVHKRLHYKYPMDQEDCMQGSMEDLIRYWKGYNDQISENAFGYYTQLIKNGSAKAWKRLHPPELKTISFSELFGDEDNNLF